MLRNMILGAGLLVGLIGCGEDDSGPNGQSNTFSVTLDGDVLDFDLMNNSAFTTMTSSVGLSFLGTRDPVADIADDEFSYAVRLALAPDGLAAVSAPANLPIRLRVEFGDGLVDLETVRTEVQNGHATLITAAVFRRSGFLAPTGPGVQTLEGLLRLTTRSESSLAGRLDLTVRGDVPTVGGPVEAVVEVDFDVALP